MEFLAYGYKITTTSETIEITQEENDEHGGDHVFLALDQIDSFVATLLKARDEASRSQG